MPGGDDFYQDELDADLLETLAIVALAGALAFLVYYRQLRQQIHQRQNEQRNQGDAAAQGGEGELLPGQQQDGGFFPPPDDPNFDMWRAGGIGH